MPSLAHGAHCHLPTTPPPPRPPPPQALPDVLGTDNDVVVGLVVELPALLQLLLLLLEVIPLGFLGC